MLEMAGKTMKQNIYHACRLVHIATSEGVPWHYIVHALRQGLELDSKTYHLTQKDFDKYPQLQEIITQLNCTK